MTNVGPGWCFDYSPALQFALRTPYCTLAVCFITYLDLALSHGRCRSCVQPHVMLDSPWTTDNWALQPWFRYVSHRPRVKMFNIAEPSRVRLLGLAITVAVTV